MYGSGAASKYCISEINRTLFNDIQHFAYKLTNCRIVIKKAITKYNKRCAFPSENAKCDCSKAASPANDRLYSPNTGYYKHNL